MPTRRRRPLTGEVRAVPAVNESNSGLTFPAHLVHPRQSEVVQYSDAIADRIVQLDAYAQQLAEGFGISFTSFVLNPEAELPTDNGLALVVGTLRTLVNREERVSLERRSGKWALYFTRSAALIGQERTSDVSLLRDAPLDVRERFLSRSETFFREYLDVCRQRLERMQSSVRAGDSTLALLARLRLE